MNAETKEEQKTEQPQPKKRNWLKILATVLVLSVIGFIGFDGYINRWAFVRSIQHYNQLELQRQDGTWVVIRANTDFRLHRIDEIAILFNPDSLSAFDAPFRNEGFGRLYFRISDSSSAKMERLYRTLSTFDTAETIRQSIEDARRNYRKLLYALKIDTVAVVDSSKKASMDSTKRLVETGMSGSDKDFSTAVGRLLRNPQLAIGAGLGLAAAFGIELLQGDAYVAVAKEGILRVDSLRFGAEVARWEGNPIDVLWAFEKRDSSQRLTKPDTLSLKSDSLVN